MPAVAASASPEYSATWIGIDGTTSTILIQTGTSQQTAEGLTEYYAWVELFPGNEDVIGNSAALRRSNLATRCRRRSIETTANMMDH